MAVHLVNNLEGSFI